MVVAGLLKERFLPPPFSVVSAKILELKLIALIWVMCPALNQSLWPGDGILDASGLVTCALPELSLLSHVDQEFGRAFFPPKKNWVSVTTSRRNEGCYPGKTNGCLLFYRPQYKRWHKAIDNSTWLYQEMSISSEALEGVKANLKEETEIHLCLRSEQELTW